jgi:hypothetical protein
VTAAACILNGGPASADAPAVMDRCNAPEPADGRVTARQLDAIMHWITERFDLPRSAERPAIVFESPVRLARMRHGGFSALNDLQARKIEWRSGRADILALYNDARRTIYLSDDWSGTTAAELSVLVHEMVHHLQNSSGLKYNCPAAREKIAYQAQSAWLRQFGKSLKSEFGLDGLSILVHTNCM